MLALYQTTTESRTNDRKGSKIFIFSTCEPKGIEKSYLSDLNKSLETQLDKHKKMPNYVNHKQEQNCLRKGIEVTVRRIEKNVENCQLPTKRIHATDIVYRQINNQLLPQHRLAVVRQVYACETVFFRHLVKCLDADSRVFQNRSGAACWMFSQSGIPDPSFAG